MTRHRLLLAWVVIAISTTAVHADDTAMRAAKRHFDRGEKLYTLTKFSEALAAYQEAFDAAPLPAFLFNIGQCYRNLGDYESAIFSYRKYLKLAVDPPNRDQVEQLILDLEDKAQRSEGRRLGLSSPRPGAAAGPPADRPVYKQWWFWTGVAVVGIAGAGATYQLTRSQVPATGLGNIVFGR
jgi:tetratricopeptide (TPR) repeat protein